MVYPRTWEQAPSSGIAIVDAVVRAVIARDVDALAGLIVTTQQACGSDLVGPVCPSAVAAGTPAPAFYLTDVGRGDRWLRIDEREPRMVRGIRVAATRREVAEAVTGRGARLGAVLQPLAGRPAVPFSVPATFVVYVALVDESGRVTDTSRMLNGVAIALSPEGIVGVASTVAYPLDLEFWYRLTLPDATVIIPPAP